jgi:hypothetical protein
MGTLVPFCNIRIARGSGIVVCCSWKTCSGYGGVTMRCDGKRGGGGQ